MQNEEVEKKESGSAGNDSSITTKAIAVVGVVGLIVLGLWYFLGTQNKNETIDPLLPETEKPAESVTAKEYPEVVAVVNGVQVTNKEFQNSYAQVIQVASQQGADVNDASVQAEMESQAIDILINTLLLQNATEEAGYTSSDEEVATEMAALEAQYGSSEALAQAINENGLTMEGVMTDIRNRLRIDAYLASKIDESLLVVSEAEVQAAYDSFAGSTEEIPSLEEAYTSIEVQIAAQKRQEAVGVILIDLREKAEIEILI